MTALVQFMHKSKPEEWNHNKTFATRCTLHFWHYISIVLYVINYFFICHIAYTVVRLFSTSYLNNNCLQNTTHCYKPWGTIPPAWTDDTILNLQADGIYFRQVCFVNTSALPNLSDDIGHFRCCYSPTSAPWTDFCNKMTTILCPYI
jgi:hypothetical protein